MIPIILLTIDNDDDRNFMIRLYEEYRWFMYKIAYEIIQDSQIAEDMVSQAICELIDALADIREIPCCKLKSYIALIVRNDSIDFVRKRKRQSKYSFFSNDEETMNAVAADAEVDAALIRDAEIKELKKGLSCLSESERMLLTMKYLDNASDAEIAVKLGISAASVRSYLTRARRRLYHILKEEDSNA